MRPELQRRIQRYGWDRAAASYDEGWSRQLEPGQNALLDLAGLCPGEGVLDVACGTGLVSFRAARLVGPQGSVTGTDIAGDMIRTANVRAQASGSRNLTFLRMDAENLDLADGTFDAALSGFGLMYVPDPVRALGEMRRVLASGGRAAVAVWGERRACGWADIFPIVDARVRSEVCPMFFQLGTGDNLARSMSEAGFDGIRVERIVTTLVYVSDADAIRAAFDAGPVALAASRFDTATRRAAEREYLASLARYRAGSGYHVPGEFVVAAGRPVS